MLTLSYVGSSATAQTTIQLVSTVVIGSILVGSEMFTFLLTLSCPMAHEECVGLNFRERGLMVDGVKDCTWNV